MSNSKDDKSLSGDIFSVFGPEVRTSSNPVPEDRARTRVRRVSGRSRQSPSDSLEQKPVNKRPRRTSSNNDIETDVSTLSSESDQNSQNVKNRREKLFIIDMLKNAEEKKEKVSKYLCIWQIILNCHFQKNN